MIVIIMAGGLGKRMESDLPKVLHKVYGIIEQKPNNHCVSNYIYEKYNKPMIVHVINSALKINPKKIFIIVGSYRDIIENTINQYIEPNDIIEYVIQEQALGTGHAVKCCLPRLVDYPDCKTLILSGDVPLISINTIEKLTNNSNKLLVTKLSNPYGCGRIILDGNRKLVKIVEEKDCDESQKLIQLVNCGIYQINSNVLIELLPKITNDNKANEYYLTDIISLMIEHQINIDFYELEECKQYEIKNINTKKDLEELNNFLLDLR